MHSAMLSRTLGAIVLVARFKVLDLFFGFLLRDAVGLLYLPRQLIALAGNHVEVIVGKLAPLRFHLALELLPVAFNDIPVHSDLLWFGPRPAKLPIEHPWLPAGLSPRVGSVVTTVRTTFIESPDEDERLIQSSQLDCTVSHVVHS